MPILLSVLVAPVNVIGAVILFAVAAAHRDEQANSFLPWAFWTTAVLVGIPNLFCAFVATVYLARGHERGPIIGYLLSLGFFAFALGSAVRNRRRH